MSLFLVNTRHNQDCRFMYRVPEQTGIAPAYIDIKMGEQRELPGNPSEPAIQAIVESNIRYGMIEAGTGLPKGAYVPMLWSRKPITEKWILATIEHNQFVTRQRSQNRLDASALQIANSIDEGLHRSQMPDRLRVLEATIQEVGEGDAVDDAVRVSRTPQQREQGEYKRRNSRRSASA